MNTRLKIGITVVALMAAGCAGNATTSASAGGTLSVDAMPVRTLSGAAVTAGPSGIPVTGRDWNCRGCYK
jgi:hypothetical protein